MQGTMQNAQTFENVIIPDDSYNVTQKANKGVKPDPKTGIPEKVVVEFEIEEGDSKGKIISSVWSNKMTKNTKLGAYVTLAEGRELKPGETVDFDKYNGMRFRVATITIEKADNTGTMRKRSIVEKILRKL